MSWSRDCTYKSYFPSRSDLHITFSVSGQSIDELPVGFGYGLNARFTAMHTQLFHCSATMCGVKPFLYVQVHLIQSVTIRSLNHVRSINVNVIKKNN